jgi:hypothetical protein
VTTPELPSLTNGSVDDEHEGTRAEHAIAQPSKVAVDATPLSSSRQSLFDLPAVPLKQAATAAETVSMALTTRPVKKKEKKEKKTSTPTKADDDDDAGKHETQDKIAKAQKGKPPSAKKSQNTPKSESHADDKWKGLPSEATRKKKRPSGCSKCRWKVVGCTPSCWRK